MQQSELDACQPTRGVRLRLLGIEHAYAILASMLAAGEASDHRVKVWRSHLIKTLL